MLHLTNLVVVTSLSQLLEVQVVLSEWTYACRYIYIYVNKKIYIYIHNIHPIPNHPVWGFNKFEPRPIRVSWWFLRCRVSFFAKKVDLQSMILVAYKPLSQDLRWTPGIEVDNKNAAGGNLGRLCEKISRATATYLVTKLIMKHPLNTCSIYLESWIEISQTTIWRCSQLRISDTCIPASTACTLEGSFAVK